MELLHYYRAHGLIAQADGRHLAPTGEYYLVDGQLCVLGQHAASDTLVPGTSLLAHFATSRALQEEVRRHLLSSFGENLLFPTRRGALLLMADGFAHSGLALAIRPPEGICELLDEPAAFFHLLPRLVISERLLPRNTPHSAAGVRLATEWYHRVYRAFSYGKEAMGEEMLHAMAVRLHRLAELLGCCATWDLSGFAPRHGEQVEWGLLSGAAMAAMLAAGRLSSTKELQITLLRSQLGDPMLQITFSAPGEDPLPELTPLRCAAAMRGTLCTAFWQAELRQTVMQISLCYAPLEVQDVKEQHPLLSRAEAAQRASRARPIPSGPYTLPSELRFDEEE